MAGSMSVGRSRTVAWSRTCWTVPAVRIPRAPSSARDATAEISKGMSDLTSRGSIGSPSGPGEAMGSPPTGVVVSAVVTRWCPVSPSSGQRASSSAYSTAPSPRTSDDLSSPARVPGKASTALPSVLIRIRSG